ncbi:MAG: hypothetical protein PHI53_02990 [Candidatus Pacebacteria bacterium]|nr:hypothetical protein [Candidatus Paceibacterota bacterium]
MKLSEYLSKIGRPVAYYPRLAKFIGSVKTTLFLCQFLYWEGKQKDKKEGWIFKTQKEITEETGLSRYEQELARKELKQFGYLKETHKSIPRKVHYKILWDKFNTDWERWIETQEFPDEEDKCVEK